ncbi:FtsK/SpoIIIE domain-containing protein [Sporolactobacillus terrae]|uniref:FtsK/SpoIIIE domain-containing protein n=1 Tax=Sporolactobacillus terrae TaxID=269673 RepID=UPI00048F18D6|nr:FtsK/SpoIIIE domain-containing protein [Sporolactobacillus terrae]
MLFEIASSVVVAGIGGYAFCKKSGVSLATNDAAKIKRIFENANLGVKEEGRKKTIRLHRKRPIDGGMEYVYQMPLGMSFKEVESHKDVIEDGLNVQAAGLSISLSDLRKLKFNRTITKQIKRLLTKHKKARKEIELGFDGMLRIRVYDEPLPSLVKWKGQKISGWKVPAGMSRRGMIEHDFEAQPHLIVAGSTGFGKSVFLKQLITALAISKPDDLELTLIDLKDGSAFRRFENLKQTMYFATDPDSAGTALKQAQELMNRRLREYAEKGYEDAQEAGIPKRHFIVIDEAADLGKEALEIVKDIARRGRGPGFRLIYATQYPTTETIPSQVKRNIPARLCFVLDSATASMAALDMPGAENLPEIKGRGIYKRVKLVIVQTPFISNQEIKKQIAVHIRPRKENEHEHAANREGRSDTFVFSET